MGLEKQLGMCLCSQEIRAKIRSDSPSIIVPCFNEKRIQPSSFEPTIGDHIFKLDTEEAGIFRPEANEEVHRTIAKLPALKRRGASIRGGFEIKKGFSYLIPLEEKIILQEGEYIKSSPKSSFGRVFLNTRLLTDYNPCFDEINAHYKTGKELDLWLLLQPLAFNLIVYPGLSLNQLRFFKGRNFQLTPEEILAEFNKTPLLYVQEGENLVPSKPIITDGLQIHLDLSGESTGGIVGLRARLNPDPIDLKTNRKYNAEEFFEPIKIKNDKKIVIAGGQHYLLCSKEWLKIPRHLNVELKSHSHIGIEGPLHRAGFIDNCYEGNLVCEVTPNEIAAMQLIDWMPISKLDVFRTDIPDKTYGRRIGSNYQKQMGPKTAKFFKIFDFGWAAKNYAKLDRNVLVNEEHILRSFRRSISGFEYLKHEDGPALCKTIEETGFFHSRYDCDSLKLIDPLILQLLPYIVYFGQNSTVFSYVRASDIKKYGEKGLFGKHSIGVGGHINESDGPDFIKNNVRRESEEEVHIIGSASEPKLIGTIVARTRKVDKNHFGMVYVVSVNGSVTLKECSAVSGDMVSIDKLMRDKEAFKRYETWSRCLIPHLTELYSLTQQTKTR